jgi:23S rRNA pseudouridine2605 synthase
MERIQRILSSRGIASRRVAEEMIVSGRVSVNGLVVTELGSKANPDTDTIRVDGKVIRPQRRRYIMLNKPRGYITTTSDERERRTVMDLVNTPERLYPVGRLDRDTEGLLLLTNDGELANRVMHPKFGLEKEYHIVTPVRPEVGVLERVRRGIVIDGKRVTPNEFRIFRETRDGVILTIALHEGMYHVVRRMMDVAGILVERLTRVRVGPLTVTGIPVGTWRDLSMGEKLTLFESVHMDLPEELAATRRTGEISNERVQPESGRRSDMSPSRRSTPPTYQRPVRRPLQGPAPVRMRPGDQEDRRAVVHGPVDAPVREPQMEPKPPRPERSAPQVEQRPVTQDQAATPPAERPTDQSGRRTYDRDGSPSRAGYVKRKRPANFPDNSGRPTHRRGPKPDPTSRDRNDQGPRKPHQDGGAPTPPRKFDQPQPGNSNQKPKRRDDDGRGAPPRNERSGPQPSKGDRDRRSGGGRKDNGRKGTGGSSRGDAV